jgi:hypothetical protein
MVRATPSEDLARISEHGGGVGADEFSREVGPRGRHVIDSRDGASPPAGYRNQVLRHAAYVSEERRQFLTLTRRNGSHLGPAKRNEGPRPAEATYHYAASAVEGDDQPALAQDDHGLPLFSLDLS